MKNPLNLMFAETEEALLVATGLTDRDQLWKAGVNLDDWDYAIVMKLEDYPREPMNYFSLMIEEANKCGFNWYELKNGKTGEWLKVGLSYHS